MIQFKNAAVTAWRQRNGQFYFLLTILNFFALVLYTVIHLGVYGVSFTNENGSVVLKLFLAANLLALGLQLINITISIAERFSEKLFSLAGKLKLPIALLIITIGFAACQTGVMVRGAMKDLNTGISTTYQGLQPTEALLIMNGEELNHTDIPLGESFTLVNKSVKGFTVKDGRFSVGAALTITDTSGKVLLQEADLFKDNPGIAAAETQYLKCIVTTGEPMQWDEHYNIKVRFWDKWGEGSITNEVKVFMNGELAE